VKYGNSYEYVVDLYDHSRPKLQYRRRLAEYELDIRLWSAMTDIAEVKKSAAVVGGLSGPAKDFCATLSLENVVLLESSAEAVLNYLRIVFAASNEMQLLSDIASFLDYFRIREMRVSSFIVGYKSRLARLKSISHSRRKFKGISYFAKEDSIGIRRD
jgi:hypothetical protein